MKELTDKIRVEMNQDDIRLGVAGNSNKCPVARAIKRAVGRKFSVRVGGEDGELEIGGKYYARPQKVDNFVARFDKGYWMKGKELAAHKAKFKPITFIARLVVE